MRPFLLCALALGLTACDSSGVDGDLPNDGLPAGTVRVDARQTYLRTYGDDALDAPAVSLAGLGVEPGRTACFESSGDYLVVSDVRASDRRETLVTAVFTAERGLHPATVAIRSRLVAPVNAGSDVVTPNTYVEDRPTDIEEDFAADDACVLVPSEARYVYFSAVDDFYADNTDLREGGLPLRVRVTPQ